jgi:hypothetical protein
VTDGGRDIAAYRDDRGRVVKKPVMSDKDLRFAPADSPVHGIEARKLRLHQDRTL